MVHAEYTTRAATPTVASFNPYLPLPGRLLEVLLAYGAGVAIETCNRDLAKQARCSASAIPGGLRTLEARS